MQGVQRMVDDDVLHRRAHADLRRDEGLQAVALELLDGHLNSCVADAIGEGGSAAHDKIAEASAAVARLVRS